MSLVSIVAYFYSMPTHLKKSQISSVQELRRPIVDAYVDGETLAGKTIFFRDGNFTIESFELKNVGDAPATSVRLRLFIGKHSNIQLEKAGGIWGKRDDLISQEPGFPNELHYHYFEFTGPRFSVVGPDIAGSTQRHVPELERLDPTETVRILTRDLNRIFVNTEESPIEETTIPAFFNIYYGQPTPRKIPFNIAIKKTS